MNLETLQRITRQGESETVEFKKSVANLDAAGKTLCGFLNAKGGMVLIGVNDKGILLGQECNDSLQKKLSAFLLRFEPQGSIQVEWHALPNQQFLLVLEAIPLDDEKPYSFDGKHYKRVQSTTTTMTRVEIKQAFLNALQYTSRWEALPAKQQDIHLLDAALIRRVVDTGITSMRLPESIQQEPINNVLLGLELIENDKLCHAAFVLFGKQINSSYPQCFLKMARFLGDEVTSDYLDNQQIYGNVFELLDHAMAFIRRHLPIASYFKPNQLEREDIPAVPLLAVREALINSLCHRDYSDEQGEIAIAIYNNRMEIWNNGGLPAGLTVEDLKRVHGSKRRNKKIAEVFYQCKLIDRWGSGTLRILEQCQQQGLPEPEFQETRDGFCVRFFFKPASELPQTASLTYDLSARQQAILTLLSQHPSLSPSGILLQLAESITDRTLRHDLNHLKQLGLIESQGKGPRTRWYKLP